MPFELEADVPVDPDVEVWVDEVAAGVDELAAGVEDEPLEPPPQAATASAASTSRTAVQARRDRVFTVCIIAPIL
jgi:hypothetical protein